ncbi:MAG: efflux RND transporter permease subunit [Saprospiraceae bacterium]
MDFLKHIKEFKPTSWSINNKTSVYIFTILITLTGLSIFISIPKEQFPDVVIPTIFVSTIYPEGANPEDIEKLITKPIENQLKSINGIKRVTSRSVPNLSLVTVEFNTDVATADAKQKVSDAVDKAKNDLPTDLDQDPQIQEVDISEQPIMQVNIVGDLPLTQLNKYAEDLEDKIEGIKEITRVDVIGAPKREVQVNIDLYKMQMSGFSFSDIENAIAGQNVNISAGELRINELRRTLRVIGEFKSMSDIENIMVRSFRGNAAFLRDIATVTDGFEEKQDFARLDGKAVITLSVIKRAGQNLIEASEKIVAITDEYQRTKLPPGAGITITGDTADQTKVQLNDLINTVILGFLFVFFILLFFMGLESAFFVALAVPLSTMLAFLFMPSLGFTLNIMVLFSLLLALGIIVDDAIVVIENTHRIFHQNPTIDIKTAAKAAAGEVFAPVLAGTLTTIAPFFPLLFWPGIAGKFMKFLPMTLIITLFASLFVAFIMNPVFAVDTMKREEGIRKSKFRRTLRPMAIFGVIALISYLAGSLLMGNLAMVLVLSVPLYIFIIQPVAEGFQLGAWPALIRGYRNVLNFLVHRRGMPYVAIFSTVVLLFVSIGLFVASNPKVEFFPEGQPNFAFVYCKLPVGTDASVTDSLTKLIEKKVYEVIGQDNPNVKSVITNVGIGAGDPMDPDRVVTPHKSKVAVAFVPFEKRRDFNTAETLNKIRENIKGIPGAEISVEKEPSGPPVGKPITVEISGDDYATLAEIQTDVINKIAQAGIEGIEDLRSDLVRNKPEILIKVDVPKAQADGLSSAQIVLDIRKALFGSEASKFRDAEEDEDTPIMVRLDPVYRDRLEDLMNMEIAFMDMGSGMFKQVPISAYATIEYTTTFTGINRKGFRRVVTLGSNVLGGYNANEIVGQINQVITTLDLPEGYDVRMTGEQEDQAETTGFLGSAFLGALALMFLIMVTQFNSGSKPFIIFSTVLFSLIGVFLGHAITGMTMSIIMTGVGIFALSGIVIRNGILLLEFADVLQQRGVPFREAIIEAGTTRITPVFLTAICSIAGLVPLAIGLNMSFSSLLTTGEAHFYLGGDNVAFWGPLAWTMIFGLIVATFLTLLVVPCMLYAYESFRKGISNLVGRTRVRKNEPTVEEYISE